MKKFVFLFVACGLLVLAMPAAFADDMNLKTDAASKKFWERQESNAGSGS